MKKKIAKALLSNRILGSGYITDTTISHPGWSTKSHMDITITVRMCDFRPAYPPSSPSRPQKVILIKVDNG